MVSIVAVKRVLFVSNGHGEDTIGAKILSEMRSLVHEFESKIEFTALPLVGMGNAYLSANIELAGPRQVLPTGGFARQSAGNLRRDIEAGLVRLLCDQVRTLKNLNDLVDYIVCVGDILPLFLTGYFMKRKSTLIATAKSDYYNNGRKNHFWIEILLMRRYADLVFTRDAITAMSLNASGVNALYKGNAMMDCMNFTEEPFAELQQDAVVIGILPGSRNDAYSNLEEILVVIEFLLADSRIPKVDFLIAAAQELDVSQICQKFETAGWIPNRNRSDKGLVSSYRTTRGESNAHIYKGRFGDILAVSDVLIGMSGTGNEQAVGMGKPVITFPGKGTQFTKKFALDQVKLLGDSICFIDKGPKAVSDALIDVVLDESKRQYMALVGRERMGLPGAAARIAEEIITSFIAAKPYRSRQGMAGENIGQ